MVQDGFIKMKRIKDNYKADMTTLDGAISDLYHDLEAVDKLDACTGYKFAKRMKELYTARRILKEVNEQIKSVERFFNLRSTIDNLDRAVLKVDREMPRAGKRKTRQEDLLEPGKIQLKCGMKV